MLPGLSSEVSKVGLGGRKVTGMMSPQGLETHPSAAGGERPPCPVLTIPTGGKKAERGEKWVRMEVGGHPALRAPSPHSFREPGALSGLP